MAITVCPLLNWKCLNLKNPQIIQPILNTEFVYFNFDFRWDPIRILYMWVRQNFAETPVTRLQKITADKKPSAKQAKRYTITYSNL